MPRLIAALFKDRAQAAKALEALLELGIAQDQIVALGRNEGREISSISGFRSLEPHENNYEATLQRLNLPPGDLRIFRQGLQRGHALVAVSVDRNDIDKAIQVLEMFDPIDLNRESREWARAHAPRDREAGLGVSVSFVEGLTNTGDLPGMRNLAENPNDFGTPDMEVEEASRSAEPTRARQTGIAPIQRDLNRTGRIWAYGTD
ncbi:hypothetical protein [Microvirga sp. 2TAF3]|uniref:hypothetical protein n=1 Tax=Microvirga sp. 2TAF3 TaxID=3233014 RepID=UPI003F9CE1CB